MSDISFTEPLSEVILDNRNEEELLSQAQLRVFNESNGRLNDFSDNSPLAALLQGQVFACAEFLYYVNQLPLALVVDFLKITGVERSLGTKAKVILTFNLTLPQSTPFIIPQGFEVVDESGNYSFFTDAVLQIPPGIISGSVTATAESPGTAYNLPAYTITGPTQPLTFLSQVSNSEPSSGGTEEESIASVIQRGVTQLRLKNLVSADDYEQAAETILGEGSVAKAVGLLAQNKVDEELGSVHLFLLNANQEPANSAQILQVKESLNPRIQLGSRLHVSPMELVDINAALIAKLSPGANVDTVIDDLWQAYQDYLNPSTYPVGQDILLNEVEYFLRLTNGIKNIQTLSLNGQPSNIPLLNLFSLPVASSLFIQLVSEEGVVYEALRGAGEPPDAYDGGFV